MTKYLVSWTEEVWQRVVIEAESREQVRELFFSGEFDMDTILVTGGEIQDGIDIEELEEE
jgi:U3 small nucleolar RNA-associated protein 14